MQQALLPAMKIISEGHTLFKKTFKDAFTKYKKWFYVLVAVYIAAGVGEAFLAVFDNLEYTSDVLSVMDVVWLVLFYLTPTILAVIALVYVSYSAIFFYANKYRNHIPTVSIKDIFLPFIGFSFLASLVITFGYIALIVPGVIFMVWYTFAPTVRALEDARGREVASYTRALVRGRFFSVLWRIIVVGLWIGIVSVPGGIFDGISTYFFENVPVGLVWSIIISDTADVFSIAYSFFLALYQVALMLVFYYNVKESMASVESTENAQSTSSSATIVTPAV